jgi:hypothetical protein
MPGLDDLDRYLPEQESAFPQNRLNSSPCGKTADTFITAATG